MKPCSAHNETYCIITAEIIATFMLVFIGTGAIIINDATSFFGLVGICFVFAGIVAAMIIIFGPMSGAHMNPAVSIALVVAKVMPVKKLPVYLVGQIIGAFLASAVLRYLAPEHQNLGSTIPQTSISASFFLEVGLTFLLMEGIVKSAVLRKPSWPIVAAVVSLIIWVEVYFAGPVTGASMNPIRSLAPAVMSGTFADQWLYVAAPILGAVLSTLKFRLLPQKSPEIEVS